jgi:hypothetical protein
MRRFLFTALLFAAFQPIFAQVSFSGVNEFSFIIADRIIEHRNYFSDKLSLQANYHQFRLGLKYDLFHPRFNRFALINDDMSSNAINIMLKSEKNENYFDEYYLQFESDYWFVKFGTLETAIGSGLALHNFYNEDFEEDTRLIGGYLNPIYDRWQLQIMGGWMESNDASLKDDHDRLGAVDGTFRLFSNLDFSAAYILHQKLINTDKDFFARNIYNFRFNFTSAAVDMKAEYALSKDDDDLDGKAIYAIASGYLGKFTITAAYKNYENFDVRISDLPMVNHIGQQLAHGWDPGKDEEGLMGEIKFLPDYDNEFIVNYAEGWSSNYKVRLSNLYTEYKRDFETFTIKAEYESLEQLNKENSNTWYKELTPALSLDCLIGGIPLLFKAEYQYKESENIAVSHSHFEPRMQMDVTYREFSLSLTVENQIGKSEAPEDGEDGEFWIGAELATSIVKNTDIRLFYGKEKGGIVCRNGVCKNQSEFSGLRLNVTTTF